MIIEGDPLNTQREEEEAVIILDCHKMRIRPTRVQEGGRRVQVIQFWRPRNKVVETKEQSCGDGLSRLSSGLTALLLLL